MTTLGRIKIVLAFAVTLLAAVQVVAIDKVDNASTADSARASVPSNDTTPKDAWPIFRGNSLSTGLATSELPEKPELLWKYTVPKGAFDATPIVADGVAYIGDLDGGLYAINLKDGSEKWKKKYEVGFYASGALRNNTFFIGDQEGMFYAIDIANGNEKWKFEGHGQSSAPNFYKNSVLYGTRSGAMHSLDIEKGTENWKYSIDNELHCSMTIVEGNVFLVGCDSVLHIVNCETGKVSGQVPLTAQAGTTPAANKDLVYFGTSAGEFVAIDWRNKTTKWSYQDKGRKQAITGSAACTTDAVYIGCEDHTLLAFKPEGDMPVWTQKFRRKIVSSPVIVDKRIVIAVSDGRIAMLDRADGNQLWKYEAGGGFTGAPAIVDGKLLIASDDGVVYCFGKK